MPGPSTPPTSEDPAAVDLFPSRSGRGRATGREHWVFARFWMLIGRCAMGGGQRAELLSGVSGDVVEVGAGDGLNFAHYPLDVRTVVAVEPEPTLRDRARRRAGNVPAPITVVDGVAAQLPLPDGSCDVAVVTLVLCSVPDQGAALAELRRVLRPGGELRFCEHVLASGPLRSLLQRLLDRSGIWPTLGAGCHLSRDTVAAIERAGFTVGQCRELESGPVRLTAPHVLGVARRS